MALRYPCPCCGFVTLVELDEYELCPVCYWEDDGSSDDDVASVAGPNGMTLAEGQRLYQRYGSSALHCLTYVRPPSPDEMRDPDWYPLPPPADERQFFLPDFGALLMALTEHACDEARTNRSEANVARFEGLSAVLRLFLEQAKGFGIYRSDVGIDPQFDLDCDLLLDDPPHGYFAG